MTQPRRVLVVGTGLVGTSVALALRQRGVAVWLADRDPTAVRRAARRGAGEPLARRPVDGTQLAQRAVDRTTPADLAVLAVPPSSVAPVLRAAQRAGLAHVYTDVASVKEPIVAQARQLGCDLSSFVPGHPLAGGHRAGPDAARADLFVGRPWVLCPGPATSASIRVTEQAVRLVGAQVRFLDPRRHDRAVALSSHLPHLVSSTLAALFTEADPATLGLTGQGVLDTTRIAAGNPELWADILSLNAEAVADALDLMTGELRELAIHLRAVADRAVQHTAAADPGGPTALRGLLERGTHGRARLERVVRHAHVETREPDQRSASRRELPAGVGSGAVAVFGDPGGNLGAGGEAEFGE